MQKVNRLSIDYRGELRQLVQPSLVFPPIVAVAPIAGQTFQIVHRHSAAPAGAGQLSRPSGACQSLAQAGQFAIRYADSEGMNRLPHSLSVAHDWPLLVGTECSVLLYYTPDPDFFKIFLEL